MPEGLKRCTPAGRKPSFMVENAFCHSAAETSKRAAAYTGEQNGRRKNLRTGSIKPAKSYGRVEKAKTERGGKKSHLGWKKTVSPKSKLPNCYHL